MAKKTKITGEDLATFQKAVAGTKPLRRDEKVRLAPRRPRPRRPAPLSSESENKFYFSDFDKLEPVQGDEFIEYKQTSISNKILRKLRKGQYNVDAILDLHGMTVEEARIAVDGCLQECLHEKTRLLLIIHGKGHHSQMPILKNKLNHWLREIHLVLAFCSAAPSHGGRGAMYVLLKCTAEEDWLE